MLCNKKKTIKKISWFFTDKIWSAGVFQWGWRQFQTNNNLISAWIYVNYTYIFICGGWTAGGGGTTFSVAVNKKIQFQILKNMAELKLFKIFFNLIKYHFISKTCHGIFSLVDNSKIIYSFCIDILKWDVKLNIKLCSKYVIDRIAINILQLMEDLLRELAILLLLLRSVSLWSTSNDLGLYGTSGSAGVLSLDTLGGVGTQDGVPSRDKLLGVDALELCRDTWGVPSWDITSAVAVCGLGWDDCGELLWDEFVCGEARGALDTLDRVPRMTFSRRRLNAVPRILDTLCCSTRPWISTTTVSGRISSTSSTFAGTFSFPDSNLASWTWRCLAKKLSMAFLCPVLVTGLSPYWIWRSSYIRSLKYWRANKL